MADLHTVYDVVIVGAGPAGSAAAIRLARAGRRVLLVERHAFPRDKVCGGCLSGTAVQELRALVGEGARLPGVAGTQIRFIIGPHRLSCSARGATRVVLRRELDAWLADAARDAGAVTRFGTAADVRLRANQWEVVIGGEPICAAYVLLACGVNGLARKLGIGARRIGPPMIGQQWIQPADGSLPALGEVELHWLRGGYVGLARASAAGCILAIAVQGRLSGASAFERLRGSNPDAAMLELLGRDAPRRFNARGTAGFPWLPERAADRNVLLIGDAAGYAEPYSGEGIGQAFLSAGCAAAAILSGGDAAGVYSARMRGIHRRVVWRTRLMGALLGCAAVHRVARHCTWLPRRPFERVVERIHLK